MPNKYIKLGNTVVCHAAKKVMHNTSVFLHEANYYQFYLSYFKNY